MKMPGICWFTITNGEEFDKGAGQKEQPFLLQENGVVYCEDIPTIRLLKAGLQFLLKFKTSYLYLWCIKILSCRTF